MYLLKFSHREFPKRKKKNFWVELRAARTIFSVFLEQSDSFRWADWTMMPLLDWISWLIRVLDQLIWTRKLLKELTRIWRSSRRETKRLKNMFLKLTRRKSRKNIKLCQMSLETVSLQLTMYLMLSKMKTALLLLLMLQEARQPLLIQLNLWSKRFSLTSCQLTHSLKLLCLQ